MERNGGERMEFVQYERAEKFFDAVEKEIIEQEDVFSLFLGVLGAIKQGKYENPFMATVEEQGNVLAIMQMTPPHPLNVIIVDESRTDELIKFIVRQLIKHRIDIPGIVSIKLWATAFADQWEKAKGGKQRLLMKQGIYRLDEINDTLETSQGHWRLARNEDCPLIEKWFSLFEEDTHLPKSPPEVVKERVASFIAGKEIFLWENEGKVVSMMKKARPTKNSVTVSLVFTPKEERKKGYARTMVMHGSEELLKDYQFCVLYTDMLNPTSNKIYQEIGYKKIADSVHIGFVD